MERDNRRLYSSMRFEGDGVTKVVALTFELREGDGLSVDFGYGLVESGYIIDYDSQPVLIIFDEPLPKQTITIRRLTQISEVPHVFQKTGNAQGGSPFNAKNIDENFENITRASQDAMDSQTLASETLEDMSGIRDDAKKYRNEAEGFRNETEVLRDSTIVKANEASVSAGKAKTSEVNAKTSETNAKHSEEEAERWAAEAQEVVIGDILVEGEGNSTTKAMTQKSVTESFNNIRTDMQLIDAELTTKFDKSDLVNTSGQSTDKAMSQKAVTDFVSDAVPVGVVKAYIGETAPNDKWLLCRGQAFSAESYPDLTQLLPDLKIPDLRGVALRGLDANRGFEPDRTLLSYQEDAMQTFDGSFYMRATTAGTGSITDTRGSFSSGVSVSEAQGLQNIQAYHKVTRIDFKPNARTSHETVMKNVAVNFIIKAR